MTESFRTSFWAFYSGRIQVSIFRNDTCSNFGEVTSVVPAYQIRSTEHVSVKSTGNIAKIKVIYIKDKAMLPY